MSIAIKMRRGEGRVFGTCKSIAKAILHFHLPVAGPSKACFSLLYRLHVAVREGALWIVRFFWYEPLFRSQCESIGERFRMESLPYIVGSGRIYIGCNVRLSGKPFITFGHVSGVSRPELLIGDDTFIGHGCTFGIAGSVTIGRHCLLAGGVRIQDYDGHPLDAALRRVGQPVGLEDVKPVEIADDVWVGTGALILKGVKIGQGAIIGARAVVTNDVLPNTVVAGNPAKLIKELITDLPGPAVSRSR